MSNLVTNLVKGIKDLRTGSHYLFAPYASDLEYPNQ